MKLNKYLYDKLIIIMLLLINYSLFLFIFVAFKVNKSLMVLFSILFILMGLLIIFYDYFRKKPFYDELIHNLNELDKKFLVLETIKMPNFYDGELLYQTLYEANKSMVEHVHNYANNINDFKDYIEMWIHEVKIPIASLVLLCHNNKEEIDKKYIKEVRRLDNYIDQVLYYVRSNYTEHDFIFKEVKLEKIISNVALKNKDDLLENKIDLEVNLKGFLVYTDPKWLEFILNQIINNSIKYKDNTHGKIPFIKIYATYNHDSISLFIHDNGIGIPKKDLNKVFDKSFTGENGRSRSSSTGMGLYIAKKLCTKLGHKIEITSKEREYTTISISMGKHEFYSLDA